MLTAALLMLAQGFEPGLSMRLYDIGTPIDELAPLVPGQTPNIDRRVEILDIKEGEFGIKDNFLAEFSGEFLAASAGIYTFRLSSDDGSSLALDGKEVVSNDGIHPVVAKEGKVRLTQGWHKISIRFFEATGGEALKLEVKTNGDYQVANSSVLRCPAGLTRVTSPGLKKLKGVGGARRPGNGMPLEKLHPSWKLIKIRPDDFKPQVGAMAFLPTGSLLLGTFKPNQSGEFLPDLADGKVYRVDGVLGDSPTPKVTLVAENIQEPLGMAVVGSRVFLAQRKEVSELIDSDGDGFYEATKTIAKAWAADNYHHFTFGLVHHEGFLYGALSTSITGGAPGINGPNPINRGSAFKIDLSQPFDPANPMRNCEFLTGGHRTPNGVSLGPNGLILVGENQGSWQPSNKINVIQPGAFFGHRNSTSYKNDQYPQGGIPGLFDRAAVTPPALYLPQNEVANSPSGIVEIPSGPFKGQMLIGDVKYGGLRRAWLHQVAGQWQGGAVAYSQGFECGTNRLAWGPDGCLYVGGTGATETWGWTDPKTGAWTTFGLEKIQPTKGSAYEIAEVKPVANGFTITLNRATKDLKPAQVAAQQWNYEPTVDYGGDKKNREILTPSKVVRLSDRSFQLTIPGLKSNRVIYLNIGARSSNNEPLWGQECWYTLNKFPSPEPRKEPLNLLVFTKTAGFRHDSIPIAVEAMKQLAKAKGFQMTHTEDASIFEKPDLTRFDAILFLSTTGDILNPAQEAKFEAFMRSGKGFVGVHAASDTEYEWPFFGELVGGYFKSHPPGTMQASIHVERPNLPETIMLPKPWQHVDEWYDFKENPRGKVEVLARLDESTYKGGTMGDHPIMWRTHVGRSRGWYTALGHTSGTYREQLFMESLYQGIVWAAGASRDR